jgi:hypothetical protein
MSQLMTRSWQRHCKSVEPSCGLPRGGLLDQRGPPGLRTMPHLRPMKPSLTRAYMNLRPVVRAEWCWTRFDVPVSLVPRHGRAAAQFASAGPQAQQDRRRTRHDNLHRRAQAQAAAKPETRPGHGCASSSQAARSAPPPLPLDCGWERRRGAVLRQAEGGLLALLRRAHAAGVAEAGSKSPGTSDGASLPGRPTQMILP